MDENNGVVNVPVLKPSTDLRTALSAYLVELRERVAYNRVLGELAFGVMSTDEQHELMVIAHTQEVEADKIEKLLSQTVV